MTTTPSTPAAHERTSILASLEGRPVDAELDPPRPRTGRWIAAAALLVAVAAGAWWLRGVGTAPTTDASATIRSEPEIAAPVHAPTEGAGSQAAIVAVPAPAPQPATAAATIVEAPRPAEPPGAALDNALRPDRNPPSPASLARALDAGHAVAPHIAQGTPARATRDGRNATGAVRPGTAMASEAPARAVAKRPATGATIAQKGRPATATRSRTPAVDARAPNSHDGDVDILDALMRRVHTEPRPPPPPPTIAPKEP